MPKFILPSQQLGRKSRATIGSEQTPIGSKPTLSQAPSKAPTAPRRADPPLPPPTAAASSPSSKPRPPAPSGSEPTHSQQKKDSSYKIFNKKGVKSFVNKLNDIIDSPPIASAETSEKNKYIENTFITSDREIGLRNIQSLKEILPKSYIKSPMLKFSLEYTETEINKTDISDNFLDIINYYKYKVDDKSISTTIPCSVIIS